jgi:predicted nuclease of predicted toxin-antitoxin system
VRFFLDHDVPVEVAWVLRRAGHEVAELREVLPVTATDMEVLQ